MIPPSSLAVSSSRGSPIGLPLRAWNEHIPIVRALRAKREPGHSLLITSI